MTATGLSTDFLATRRAGRGGRLGWRALLYAVLVFFGLLYLLPFAVELATSFKTDPDAASRPLTLIPHPGSLAAFRRLFGLTPDQGAPFLRWLSNSLIVAVCITTGRVVLDSMAGYALARLRFAGRTFLFGALLAVLSVPGVVLLIPRFLVLNTLGIFDTYAGMILPLLIDAASIFIMKQFFESLPREIEEAARIDGASVPRMYWSVVLPMARPALLTLTILSFQGSWNEFNQFLVATQSSRYETLTTGLARFASNSLGGGTQYPLKLAAALMSTIPVAVLFFCFQRYFVRGANTGAVKE